MKWHFIKTENETYAIYYDRRMKLWTSYEINLSHDQIGPTEYWVLKQDILDYIKKYGKL
jgi:hypothetical protein